MRNYRSDSTANTAIGAVDRELRKKRSAARKDAALLRSGRLSREEERRIRAQYTGSFCRALQEALEE